LVNLTFAMAMIVIMIIGIFTAELPLPLAVIGHEGGTVLVSLNGLRLLVYKGKKTRTEAETESPQTSPDVWPSCRRRKP
jgi:Cd2+/Zn2+-exporting ATPase